MMLEKKMKKVLTLLTVLLLASAGYGAVGDLHSAQAEFSTVNNPNGLWSYHVGQAFGSDPVSPYDTLSIFGIDDGLWEGPEGAPYSRIGGGGPADEPNKVAEALGVHSPFMTRWTVPAGVAAVEAHLGYVQQYEPGRQMRLIIMKNGVELVSKDSIPPTNNNYPNNDYQWVGVPDDSGTGIVTNVSEGDTIDFVVNAFGTGTTQPGTGTSSAFTTWVREADPVSEFELTVLTNPAHITSVSNYGVSMQPINSAVNVVASQYNGCQYGDGSDSRVYAFDSWTGPVADAGAAATTVTSAGEAVSITANFTLISACPDPCHQPPIYDFNGDCITDYIDFNTFSGEWMNCTQPACID